MQKLIILILSLQTTILFSQLKYPTTKTVDSSDIYFGVTYPDPYRWLEKMKEPEVESWFKQQAELTENVIERISGRPELVAEWKKLEKLKTASCFGRYIRGDKVFYQKIQAGELMAKLYFKDNLLGTEQLLFDPTKGIANKTVTIKSAVPSYDGEKVLLSYTEDGNDIGTLRIIDVNTKLFLKESIYPVLTSYDSYWCNDNKAFVYTCLLTDDKTSPDFLKNNKVKIHKVGEDSKYDSDFFSNESYAELNIKPHHLPGGELTENSPDFLFAFTGNSDLLNVYYYASAKEQYSRHIKWKKLSTAEDRLVKGINFVGNTAYAITNKNAPNYMLLATSITNPNWEKAEIIAVERKDLKLDGFTFSKDFILLTYSNGINSRLFKYEISTKITSEISLPYSGTIYVNCLDMRTNHCYIYITSWNHPMSEFKLDIITNEFSISEFNTSTEYPNEYKNIEVQEVEVKGHDGETIPLSIIYKKGTKLDGQNVCLIEGYGCFGISMVPAFNTYWCSLVTKGVVLAIPHVRGGGEKGDSWHKGGLKATKPNTWKDFIGCTEYLIERGYTSAKRVIASGSSAGGILVGRAITERPDLYGAAISASGVLNTLRSCKMGNGENLSLEFGSTRDSVECRALFEMDAIAHLNADTSYPAVICYVGRNDILVDNWQSAKFVGALQNNNPNGKPVLLLVNYNNGHNANEEDLAIYWAFALWQCRHPDFNLK